MNSTDTIAVETEQATFASPVVLEFYKTLPFNYYGSLEKQAESVVKGRANIEMHPPLIPLLRKDGTVLDVGCGAGWLTNTITYHFKQSVVGIDFNPVAVERAQEVAKLLHLSSQISTCDLFKYFPEAKFDLVISMGVLHSTENCMEGIRHLMRSVLKENGHMYIGLYHTYGRAPFLQYFEEMKQQKKDEKYLFDKYKELHTDLKDDQHLLSWFRDQVLHPLETQHTLKEVASVVDEMGGVLVSTSINRFKPFNSLADLFELEKEYEQTGRDALQQKTFFPGFFTFLVHKTR
jgi:2-polyprenyl-3-methyl-5-hydroxy-6-metoxy-1,4-benzoquinol methylase